MKKVFATLALAVLFFVSTQEVDAMLGVLTDKFSKRPYSKIVVNGKERVARLTPLAQSSHLIEWLDEKQESNLYWVEKFNKDGRIAWQASPSELSTYEYTYDEKGRPQGVLIKVIWPELKNIMAVTSRFEPCNPSEVQDCYKFQEVAVHMLVTADRDESGKIVGGTMKNTFFTQNRQTFTKEQKIRVSYPNEDTMRIEFEGFGEPWAYLDAWQEYRVESGNLVWETCRTFGKHTCKKD